MKMNQQTTIALQHQILRAIEQPTAQQWTEHRESLAAWLPQLPQHQLRVIARLAPSRPELALIVLQMLDMEELGNINGMRFAAFERMHAAYEARLANAEAAGDVMASLGFGDYTEDEARAEADWRVTQGLIDQIAEVAQGCLA